MARAFAGGSSQYLRAASCSISGYPFSFVARYRPTTLGQYQTILGIGDNLGLPYHALRMITDNTVCALTYDGSSTLQAVSSGSLSINTWYILAAVFAAADDRTVYLGSGDTDNDTSAANAVTTDATAIGISPDSTPFGPCYGEAAEAAIYAAALTLADIQDFEAGATPLMIRPDALVNYWNLIRDSDQDLVGGVHLTAYNSPTVADHPTNLIYSVPQFGYWLAGGAPPAVPIAAIATHHYRARRAA